VTWGLKKENTAMKNNRTRLVSFYTLGKRQDKIIRNGFSWSRKFFKGDPVILPKGSLLIPGDIVSTLCKPKKTIDGVKYGGPWGSAIEGENTTLSGEWDYSGLDSLSPSLVSMTFSIGIGCSWSKCHYCSNLGGSYRLRPKWDDVLITDLTKSRHHINELDLCMDGPDPNVLQRIVDIRPKIHTDLVLCFARAPDLIPSIRSGKSMAGITWQIGLEGYSNKTLRFLNRGMTVDKVLSTISRVLDLGAEVYVMLMNPFPVEKEEDIDYVLSSIKRIGCHVSRNGPLKLGHLKYTKRQKLMKRLGIKEKSFDMIRNKENF